MTDVFVSYASKDRSLALPVIQALERQKWRVFSDRSIPAGKTWQDVLRDQLTRAKCVVVLITRNSLESNWVTYEASVALQRRTLVPLLLDSEMNPNDDLPEMYRGLHIPTLFGDLSDLNSADRRTPWLQSIFDVIRRNSRLRLARIGGVAILAMFTIVALIYIAIASHDSIVEWQAGIRHLERGAYSKPENERLKNAIRNATLVELLVPNASSFINVFREDLTIFFKNPNSRMRVLFADPNSEFYRKMMIMTTNGIEQDAKAVTEDKAKLAFSRRVILAAAADSPQRVDFRQFDTEFRLPMILIDRNQCFVTIRMTPDQSTDTLRVELASKSAGTPLQQIQATILKSVALFLIPSVQTQDNIESCTRHFDAVWKYSRAYE